MTDVEIVLLAGVACVCCLIIGVRLGFVAGCQSVREDAVQHEAGHMTIDEATGEPVWKWGEPTNKQQPTGSTEHWSRGHGRRTY